MRRLLGVLVAVVGLTGCNVYVDDDGVSLDVGRSEVRGNGTKVTETRRVGSFVRVENRTPLDVVVRESSGTDVDVTLDSNLQGLLDTHVEGDRLIIERDAPFTFSGEGHVVVRTPRVTGARLASSGSLTVEDVSRREDVELVVEGSGVLRFCGPARTVSAALEGSGSLRVCTPSELMVEAVDLTVSGSGTLEYAGRALRVDAFSDASGHLQASGAAQRFVARTRGSGDVDGRALLATEAELTVQGSGDVLATSDGGRVVVNIQGSGDVELWGDANLQVNDSGSGDFIRH